MLHENAWVTRLLREAPQLAVRAQGFRQVKLLFGHLVHQKLSFVVGRRTVLRLIHHLQLPGHLSLHSLFLRLGAPLVDSLLHIHLLVGI